MEVISHAPANLYLDPANPRLADEGLSIDRQDDILLWLWRNMSVNELVDSILANGFWKHEELFATEEEGRLVVVEGNRRLAAVKILSDTGLRERLGIALTERPSEAVLESIRQLPVIHATREELWGFVGFKHVNGPQAWDSIAKAEYVFRVRRDFGLSLAEIASAIGDRHATVARLYRGYVVLRQAQEQFGFDTTDTRHRRFPFSHLWTALGYVSIRKYLGVDPAALENENPIPEERLPRLEYLMRWLFGSQSHDIEATVRRQNPDLRHLAQALEVRKGVDLLESGRSLSVALDASLGDAHLFRVALTRSDDRARRGHAVRLDWIRGRRGLGGDREQPAQTSQVTEVCHDARRPLIVDSSLAVEDGADRLERACLNRAGYLAWAEVIGQLRRNASKDEAVTIYGEPPEWVPEGGPRDIEPYETTLDEWIEALSHREGACGPSDAYPFRVSQHGLQLRESPSTAYLFQLLVSLGFKQDHSDGTAVYKLFEELSAMAAARYLGDSRTAVVFGSPRRGLPLGFRDAVDRLVDLLREGRGCADREGLNQSKDDALDVVAWREFPDRRPSKLILFGQCAVGRLWKQKTHELQPRHWCKRNFAGQIAVDPIPAFFVPRALSERDAYDAGGEQILFDRCRITALCSGAMDGQLDERLQDWIADSLQAGERP